VITADYRSARAGDQYLAYLPNPTVPNGALESAHHQYFVDRIGQAN